MAKKAKAAAISEGPRLVRKHRESGEISGRKRGRPHPDFENGYLDANNEFHSGNPRGPKRGKRRMAKAKTAAKASVSGGSDIAVIEAIVRHEVDTRLKAARHAAIAALDKALGA